MSDRLNLIVRSLNTERSLVKMS